MEGIISPMNEIPPNCLVIIPALNEEKGLSRVLQALPKELIQGVIVVDNGSTDSTGAVAESMGARVVRENRRGYGQACLAGLEAVKKMPSAQQPEIIAFMDADFSDNPEELREVLKPIQEGRAEMVIGSRVLGKAEAGSLTPVQRFGNWLSTRLIRWRYGVRYTDLGPFRAIRWETLQRLNMADTNFGWTVEMQIKAARRKIPTCEVPVSYKKRIGTSKISGTLKGSFLAGTKILWMIAVCK
jgi:glycosyltransferase involved in cell wall biosynthesis